MTSGSGFGGFSAALSAWVDNKINGVDNAVGEVSEEAAQKGENITKHHIETRGTAKSGKRGRVETGEMVNAVTGNSKKLGRGHYQSQFGWVDKKPDYARFQEPGFTHVGGSPVEGMYALSDAGEEVLQDARQDLRRKISEL